ncbi:MAG: efflux RND transporter periplasmic adaptor subunit [Clostridium sp.]|nr:efflux RND transporter periplasmic adaptor subunit [Clostridium sp.]
MKGKFTLISILMCMLCACGHEDNGAAQEAVRVEVMTAKATMLNGTRIYAGEVEASAGIDLAFTVAGMMDSIFVDEGDFVEKGQAIGQINARSLQNSHREAMDALAMVEARYEEMKQSYAQRRISEMEWAQERSALLKAKSNLSLAEKALKDATLNAPFTGYVAKRYCDAGKVVAPTLPVIQLSNIDKANVIISIPQDEISNISIGDTAGIAMNALKQRKFLGKVVERGATPQPSTGLHMVKIEVDNKDYAIRPNMACEVRISSGVPEIGIAVPPSLVLSDSDNGQYVWLAYRGKALKRMVETGGMTDSGIIIEAGLSSGDSIITNGRLIVDEYSPVLIARK